MKFPFKWSSVILIIFVLTTMNCLNYENDDEKAGFTPEAQAYVDKILLENKTSKYTVAIETVGVSNGMAGTRPTGYYLKMEVDSILVLTNTIDSLRKHGIYKENKQLYYGLGAGMADLPFVGLGVKCDTLDSIKIITDTIIRLSGLGIGSCNISKITPEINKIRVDNIDLSNNNLKDLPFEIMSIFNHLPTDSGKIKTRDNPMTQEYWDSIPDTLRNWLIIHTPR